MQRTYHFAGIGSTHAHDAIIDLLTPLGRRHVYDKGQIIAQRGDAADGFWLIESGQVMLGRFGADGRLSVFGVLGHGDILGDLAFILGTSRQVEALADAQATLIWIARPTIDHLIETSPPFARWWLTSLASQLRTALDRIETHHSLSAAARLARLLSDLADRDGPDIRLTQQELADFIGVSRVTIGQILADLAKNGALKRGYRYLTLLDRTKLPSA